MQGFYRQQDFCICRHKQKIFDEIRMFIKKLQSIVIFTILIFTFVFSAFAQDDSRSSIAWEVKKYDITANLPSVETDRNVNIKAGLTLKNISGSSGSRLTLRISESADVSAVKVNNSTADFSKGLEKINETQNLQRIIVRLPSIQANASFTVEVDYKLNVKENSGLSAVSPIGSQFLPLSFWYPTPTSWFFAGGADFAPFKLQITAPNNQTIASSGVQSGNAFEQKLFGQPFLLTGDWDVVNSNGVSVYMPKGAGADEKKRAEELALTASEAQNFTANLLGNAPDAPLRLVSVERGAGFSGGGTILIDDSAFRRQKNDAQTVMTIAEGVAKIWLGNANVVLGNGNGAIREGLSRYIATQFLENKYGKDIADVERLRQRISYSSVINRDAPLVIASPLDEYYFSTVSNKGAMIWRLLARKIGENEFYGKIRQTLSDNKTSLSEMRSAFSAQKDFLDYAFDQITDTNLLVGLPQASGGQTKIALRNAGSIEAVVNIIATTAGGEKLSTQATIPAKSFAEVNFKTNDKIVRAEIDTDKFYPQIEYSDDVAPREFFESDPIVVIKRNFDKQDYTSAARDARKVLNVKPNFDEARLLLARSLLAQGKLTDAQKEFQTILDEKLPTARSLAWANLGLGDISLKTNQNAKAKTYFNEAIKADGDYGATLLARNGRNDAKDTTNINESIKTFFNQFDKAAVSNSKAAVDALVVPGEVNKFANGIGLQAQVWNTQITQVDMLNANTALVEAKLNVRLINKDEESGTAVFKVSKIGSNWKLSGVEIFEVR